jgi:hypothetical protein
MNMLKKNTIEQAVLEIAGSSVEKVGCYYVVSIKRGGRKIASLPQATVEAAIAEFQVKYTLATL